MIKVPGRINQPVEISAPVVNPERLARNREGR